MEEKDSFLNHLKISSRSSNDDIDFKPTLHTKLNGTYSAILQNVTGYRLGSNITVPIETMNGNRRLLKRGSYMLLNIGDGDRTVKLYNSELGGEVVLASVKRDPLALSLTLKFVKENDDHPVMLIGYYDASIRYFSLPDMKELKNFPGHGGAVRYLRFVDDETFLSACWYQGKLNKISFLPKDEFKGDPNPRMIYCSRKANSSGLDLGAHLYSCCQFKKKRDFVLVYSSRIVIVDWRQEKVHKIFDEKVGGKTQSDISSHSITTYLCHKTKEDRILAGTKVMGKAFHSNKKEIYGIVIFNLKGEELKYFDFPSGEKNNVTSSLVVNGWSFLLGTKKGDIYSLNLLGNFDDINVEKAVQKEYSWSFRDGTSNYNYEISELKWIDKRNFVFGLVMNKHFAICAVTNPNEFFDKIAKDDDLPERVEYFLDRDDWKDFEVKISNLRTINTFKFLM